MKIEHYLHGLKWKDEEVSPSDIKRGYVPYHILDNPFIKDDRDMEYVQIRETKFDLESRCERIPFDDAPYHIISDIIRFSRERNGIQKMNYLSNEILHINTEQEYFIIGSQRASCNDPHVFVNNQGELAYREIETKVKPIRLMKLKKTVFDIIDLE